MEADLRETILLIEDEPGLAGFMKWELEHEGYRVTWLADGREGLNAALSGTWDVILLDILLPSLSGLEVCRRIRTQLDTPILMITARDGVPDRVAGLDSGADDYVVKPFAIEEVLARIRALIRRRQGTPPRQREQLSYHDLHVNLATREVVRAGVRVDLTAREFELLELFMRYPTRVLARPFILEEVWGYDFEVDTNIVDVYVRYLRQKLDAPFGEPLFHTVRGVGYVLRAEETGRASP
ncbi:MAG: response regulator transcription factor [Alicyclobacillus sp.]|nr:response regulator transcription factor [Alicyclobacillus sp.]